MSFWPPLRRRFFPGRPSLFPNRLVPLVILVGMYLAAPVLLAPDGPLQVGQVSLGLFQRFQQLRRVGHQDLGLRGELDPASGLAKQLDAGFLFQEGQLL